MEDATLRLGPATGSRPATLTGLGYLPGLFPQSSAPDWWDLGAVMDVARVKPIFANFHVLTSFAGPAGASNNLLRFAIWAATGPDVAFILADAAPPIGRSHDYGIAGLQRETEKGVLSRTQGPMVQVALPPMGDLSRLVAEGRRYIMGGYEINAPTDDYNAGAVSCYLTHDPLPTRPFLHPAAY